MTGGRLAACAVLVVGELTLAGAQQAAFSARVHGVRVDVLVSDRGRPVRGLQAGDFEIRDNGVLQDVEIASYGDIPLNVVLAFDMSGSVRGEKLDHLRQAGAALLDALHDDDQAGIVTFSHVVAQGSGLTTEHARVRAALDSAQADGGTALVDGTYAGLMVGESDVGRALLVVFSDGLDTSSWLSPELVVETARRSDVVAYGVSVGASYRSRFLRDLTGLTGGELLKVDAPRELSAAFLRMLDEFRHRYLLTYSPRAVERTAGTASRYASKAGT